MSNQNQSNVIKTFSPVTVDSVSPHTLNEKKADLGILSAQIRQTVTTTYPSVKINNGGLFSTDAYNAPGQTFTSQRVTWIDVPAGTTMEQVSDLLATKPDAKIVSVISNKLEDVLNEGQKAAILQKIQTLEFFEDKLRVRGTNGEELDGPSQYRNYTFMANGGTDRDLRTEVVVPAAVVSEAGQNVFGS